MKVTKILRFDNRVWMRFNNNIEINITIHTMWGGEYLSIMMITQEGVIDIVIKDTCYKKSFATITNENGITKVHHWYILNSFGVLGYVRAAVKLYRAQHRDRYVGNRSGWIGDKRPITELIEFPKSHSEIKKGIVEGLQSVLNRVAEGVVAHLLNGEMCNDCFELLNDALEAECEVADNYLDVECPEYTGNDVE